MYLQTNIHRNKILNFLVFLTLFIHYFLWDIKNLNLMFVIILPIFIYLIQDFKYLIRKNHFFIITGILFIFIHFYFSNYENISSVETIKIVKIFSLYLILIFCYLFHKIIVKNLKSLVISFCFFYYILLIIYSFFKSSQCC